MPESLPLQAIESEQRRRAAALYQPMSSPLREGRKERDRRERRSAQREERLELGREKRVHDEDSEQRAARLAQEAAQHEPDWVEALEFRDARAKEEKLGEEGESHGPGSRAAPSGRTGPPHEAQVLELELEARLAEEQQELEERLGRMALGL